MLDRRPVVVLATLSLCGAALVAYYNAQLSRELIESKALLDADLFSQAIAEARTLYTSEVVQTASAHGLAVTHDYADRSGAIPLPVTFSMLLAQRIGSHSSGESSRLYSPYPFAIRKGGGLPDDFAREAWRRLSNDPATPYYRFEQVNGASVLRYARADLMRQGCVDCHNTHPDSPKRDWKEGALRGVLEVQMPMHRIEAQSARSLHKALALTGTIALLGIALLALVLGRLRGIQTQLVGARDDALLAVRAKAEFLDNVTHELRTPLNAIIGYTELVREELQDAGQTQLVPDVDKVRGAAANLLTLVNDVIDFAQAEADAATLDVSDFDVAVSVRVLVQSLPDMTRGGELEFSLQCADDVGVIRGDERKLHRALRQLLANARKFTERGRIELRVTRAAGPAIDTVRFAVEDTGPGIEEAAQHALFTPFVQGDGSATRRHGGTGLGLALTSAYARAMGGRIEVRSQVGRGSTFTLCLPAQPPPPHDR